MSSRSNDIKLAGLVVTFCFCFIVLHLKYQELKSLQIEIEASKLKADTLQIELDASKSKTSQLQNVLESGKSIAEIHNSQCDDVNLARDFYRYQCKTMERYGLQQSDPLVRYDGSWFICNDGNLKIEKSKCVVLSFGINTDDSFDHDVFKRLDCTIHGFDPFIEPPSVEAIRNTSETLKNAVSLNMGGKWMFHSIGISDKADVKNQGQKGWIDTYENILNHLNLKDTIIDYLKIDIEGTETKVFQDILANDEGNLFCKHVKQIGVELHFYKYDAKSLQIIRKLLEKCFLLYRRDQRFFLNQPFEKSEWDAKSEFQLPFKYFNDEVHLANNIFFSGELYFVNKHFL
jgi:hypothetical protein